MRPKYIDALRFSDAYFMSSRLFWVIVNVSILFLRQGRKVQQFLQFLTFLSMIINSYIANLKNPFLFCILMVMELVLNVFLLDHLFLALFFLS